MPMREHNHDDDGKTAPPGTDLALELDAMSRCLATLAPDARRESCQRSAAPVRESVAAGRAGSMPSHADGPADGQGLIVELIPRKRFTDLILARMTRQACEELVEEQRHAERLRQHGLLPRHRVLL